MSEPAYTMRKHDLPPLRPLPDIERTVSELGAKVAAARASAAGRSAQLAQRAGLSTAAVHKIEKSGMTPTIASLMKIAAALGKSVGYFVDEAVEVRSVDVVRGDERGALYTSKQGLVLDNISGRYGALRAGRRGGRRRAARRQRPDADEPPRRGARARARGP